MYMTQPNDELAEAANGLHKAAQALVNCYANAPGHAHTSSPSLDEWRQQRAAGHATMQAALDRFGGATRAHVAAHDQLMRDTSGSGNGGIALSADAGNGSPESAEYAAAVAEGRAAGEAYRKQQLAARGIMD